jgi:hypothetical protein
MGLTQTEILEIHKIDRVKCAVPRSLRYMLHFSGLWQLFYMQSVLAICKLRKT